jgi:hypothetical protein
MPQSSRGVRHHRSARRRGAVRSATSQYDRLRVEVEGGKRVVCVEAQLTVPGAQSGLVLDVHRIKERCGTVVARSHSAKVRESCMQRVRALGLRGVRHRIRVDSWQLSWRLPGTHYYSVAFLVEPPPGPIVVAFPVAPGVANGL